MSTLGFMNFTAARHAGQSRSFGYIFGVMPCCPSWCSHWFCRSLFLTLDGGQHSASHGQNEAQRTAQQEAVWHLEVESAGVQHQAGATAASHLNTFLCQTRERTWTQGAKQTYQSKLVVLYVFKLSDAKLMAILWLLSWRTVGHD